jgi:hypothetical protein
MRIDTHPRFKEACSKVAKDWRELCRAIRIEDEYAAHVTEAQKDKDLSEGLALADEIERGEINSFTIWQRVNLELTGECVAFLP